MICEVEFEHALLTEPAVIVGAPEKGVIVVLDATKVYAVMYMPQHKATSIIAIAGGHVVVKETVAEARVLIKDALEKLQIKSNTLNKERPK